MRSELVSGHARRTARRMATIPYPALSAPSLALRALPALCMPLSPSSLPLSALAVLPSLSSFVSYLFCPARAPFPRPCRPSLHDTTHAHSTLHLWGRAALWQHAAAPRLAARSVVGYHVTPFSAPPSRSLCPPASACTVRSNSPGSAPSLPLSLPRPPGPVLPPVCSPSLTLPCPSSLVVCSFSLVLPCPPSQARGSLALCLLVPVLALPSLHTHRGAIREAPLPLPLHLAAPWRPGP